ncbi:gag-pol polyprotein [Trifolium medium]|nr:gag-pol polyprotein [Trifolium medium]
MDRRPRSNVQNIKFDISKQANTQKKTRTYEKTNQAKGVQYHECEGYGHIRTECATYLKK